MCLSFGFNCVGHKGQLTVLEPVCCAHALLFCPGSLNNSKSFTLITHFLSFFVNLTFWGIEKNCRKRVHLNILEVLNYRSLEVPHRTETHTSVWVFTAWPVYGSLGANISNCGWFMEICILKRSTGYTFLWAYEFLRFCLAFLKMGISHVKSSALCKMCRCKKRPKQVYAEQRGEKKKKSLGWIIQTTAKPNCALSLAALRQNAPNLFCIILQMVSKLAELKTFHFLRVSKFPFLL